ncbi:GTP-binding protein [Massarina eburnea CBS 473.64]|uniref:GTP-binding protein n=1 Tax=Massarina eburnea CBS 473.64 TaxID=1395130 RepID=A0A6A6RM72_9PLEO|nr:GTP-binding protein [Massarina eburnea CBS 473.64]
MSINKSDIESDGSMTPTSPVEIDTDTVTTSSLEALQSDGQRKILDIVDDLRRQGLSGIVELPQIIVCGDQSSGKSSVLEAITEIPFPRNENLCTRFATEIILRRHVHSSISTRITPDKGRNDGEQEELRSFSRTITDFTELPKIIAEAEKAMGLQEIGQSRAFARDVLTVEISGPTRPQLTLVDLPGLIHSANRQQSEDDVKLITELVLDYMKSPRTICLAVITAKNDYANQIVLKHCQTIDPNGRRTLGIITKPDSLTDGSANQKAWLELAQNRDIYFELGWHMVKNRSEVEGSKTFLQRNVAEKQFFSKGAYADLPNDCKGIETLRTRLSSLLQDHLKNELPHLKTELMEKLQKTTKELQKLGIKRSTVPEQRMFLTDISQGINELLKSAIRGQYDSEFFGSVNMKADVHSTENIRRFRAVVQHLNLQFADHLHRIGHKYAIPTRKGDNPPDSNDFKDSSTSLDDLPRPIEMSRDEGIDWVHRTLERSRGCELPGNFNPLIISQLFWEQSTPWNELALRHIEKISELCKQFVDIVLQEAAPSDIRLRLSDLCVDVMLDNFLKEAKHELDRIIKDKARHPMTYNHYFTTKIQDQRKTKYAQILSSVAKACSVSLEKEGTGVVETYIDPGKLETNMNSGIEQNMDKFSAEDALDSQIAYYADELKYFINCISKQVVERHLVDTLGEKVLSPRVIAGLTDAQISLLAAEASEVSRMRERLEGKVVVLEKGLGIFKEALGGFS